MIGGKEPRLRAPLTIVSCPRIMRARTDARPCAFRSGERAAAARVLYVLRAGANARGLFIAPPAPALSGPGLLTFVTNSGATGINLRDGGQITFFAYPFQFARGPVPCGWMRDRGKSVGGEGMSTCVLAGRGAG